MSDLPTPETPITDWRRPECRMCRRPMNVDDDDLSHDCGGDCWGCTREIEEEIPDPRPPVAPRDFITQPYTEDEQRVIGFLRSVIADVNFGPDPIGYLMAAYDALHDEPVIRTSVFRQRVVTLLEGRPKDE